MLTLPLLAVFLQWETKCSSRNYLGDDCNIREEYYKQNLFLVLYNVGLMQLSIVQVNIASLLLQTVFFKKTNLYSIFSLKSPNELLPLGTFYSVGSILDKLLNHQYYKSTKIIGLLISPKYSFLNITSHVYIQILKVLFTSFMSSTFLSFSYLGIKLTQIKKIKLNFSLRHMNPRSQGYK